MEDVDVQSPEGALIDACRERLRPKLSARRAAELSGISEGRWRQIIKGYQQVTSDVRAPVRAPAETLARMAWTVDASPEQLREVGRADAAEELIALKANLDGASRTDPGELADLSPIMRLNAITVDQLEVMANLPFDMTKKDLEQLARIRSEAERLPEVLKPFLDSPAGTSQYIHSIGNLMAEARDIIKSYTDPYFPSSSDGAEAKRRGSVTRARLKGR
ncbi:Uncharacterised protein [Mycobacteroides abscessus subsp. massiliense]|uniref:hypothetical protein n=1 Tax=Mycobacteroides abscessus TaxID=36809 RepID=UPI0009A892B5|nr:hypothetical protein [Mycobacteroides abscessus]SKJ41228.1 Uncharacterised protein [Mycobacteroides abscessus subsp. massiliense]